MNAITTAERAQMRELAHQLARCELEPRAEALDAGDTDALAHCWQLLVDTGLDRALLDEHHGGSGLDLSGLLAVVEELALGDAGVAMCALLCNAALTTLDEEQLEHVGEGARWTLVPAPEHAGAGALDTGAGPLSVADDDGRLNGQLPFALGAYGADGLVLVCADRPSHSAWAVEAGAAGLALARDTAQMGLRGAPGAAVALGGVEPLADWALDGSSALDLLRMGSAAIAHGIARRAYEMALDYALQRRQGGVAIIEHDAVADMLSAMCVRLERWPEACDSDRPQTASQALAAKIAATQAAVESATDAVQVFGGTGYMVETGVEKLMRDAMYCQLFPAPNWMDRDELIRSRPVLAA